MELGRIQFSPDLENFKRELWDLYKSVNNVKGTNEQLTDIFFQFLIHRNLTQKELRELTHFSLGYISETMNYFLDYGVVERAMLEGSNEYEYSLVGSFLGMGKILFLQMKKEIQHLQSAYYSMLGKWMNPDLEPTSDKEELIAGLRRMIRFLEEYEGILERLMRQVFSTQEKSPVGTKIMGLDHPEQDKHNDSVKRRVREENASLHMYEILNLFSASKIMPYNQNSRRKLFGAMIFLEKFTAKELREVANLSYKTFKEHFAYFEENRKALVNIPPEERNPTDGEEMFQLAPIQQIIARNMSNTSNEIGTNIARMVEIKGILENEQRKYGTMPGYDQLLAYLKDYFEIVRKIK